MNIHSEHDAIEAAICELHRARRLYPNWPRDIVHAAAIVSEEAGEVVQSVNDIVMHGRGSRLQVTTEVVQLIAMGIRFLCDTTSLRDGMLMESTTYSGAGDNAQLRQCVCDQDAEIQRLRAENARLTAMVQGAWIHAPQQPCDTSAPYESVPASAAQRDANGRYVP